MPHITFLPSKKSDTVVTGTRISDSASMIGEADLHLECGGKGICNKCIVELVYGSVEKKGKTISVKAGEGPVKVLSCQCRVCGDAVFFIPAGKAGDAATMKLGRDIVAIDPDLLPLKKDISPVITTLAVRVKPPSTDANFSDLKRLELAISEKLGTDVSESRCDRRVLVTLAGSLRKQDGNVTIRLKRDRYGTEIVAVDAGQATGKEIGIACDIGTTTVSAHFVDLSDGTILSSRSDYNGQIRRGADIISRIEYAKTDTRREEMRGLVLTTINGLIDAGLSELKISPNAVYNMALAGNTTMIHLLLGLETQNIRESPYVPVNNSPGIIPASEVGLHINPHVAVSFAPGVGSYVGGDITSGLLTTPMIYDEKNVSLFMDIGTNGEIVIGNAEFLMAAACSAGPAFEGSGIKCGMRAAAGAIESFETDPDMKNVKFSVVGGGKAKGICGSGLISLLGELYTKGIIDQRGKFSDRTPVSRTTKVEGTPGLILISAADSQEGKDIIITEADIDNLIRTKGAIYAACDLMLSNIGLTFDSIHQVYIAGGFGRFIDVEQAVHIGLLPDIGRDKFTYLGNSSLTGAALALLSNTRRQQLKDLAGRMTYIDLSSDNRYMDAYVAALFLPHTDMARFPSVGKK
jgi:uncharacterized 2Fe-2S/4Fe-4S cluster protein (DUF4445 family)